MAIKKLPPDDRKTLPVRKEETHPFALFRQEMNTLFDSFSRGFELEPFDSQLSSFRPNVDVTETEKEVRVTAEFPGMDEKDIEVSLTKDALTIKGEKKLEKEDKGKNYYRMERSYGSFLRTIPLPAEIDREKADAQFLKGLLTIVLPKTADAVRDTKKIKVKTE